MVGRLTSTEGLKAGDVVIVAVEIRKSEGTYWWKRFACVADNSSTGKYAMQVLTLKLRPEALKDLRLIDIRKDVVTLLAESDWPEGVVAMRMKLIMQGVIKLDG